MSLDINAPIIPGLSAGGFKIGTKVEVLESILDNAILSKNAFGYITTPLTSVYQFSQILSLFIDLKTGVLYKISVCENYKGLLLNSIRTGNKISEILKLKYQLLQDDFNNIFYIKNVPGVLIEPDVLNY